jgi:hypothetical protein
MTTAHCGAEWGVLRTPSRSGTYNTATCLNYTTNWHRSQVSDELRQEGLIRDPSPEELEHAAAWDSLPEAEKRNIDEELDALHLDPLLSEIIDLNRAGRAVEL